MLDELKEKFIQVIRQLEAKQKNEYRRRRLDGGKKAKPPEPEADEVFLREAPAEE